MGAVGVIVVGVLMHFAYDASGGQQAVAAFAPANESVWEHLKMVLLPVVALGAVESRWVLDRPRLWWAKLVEVVAASGSIVAFFYTYTGALGVHSLVAVDISSYLAAVAGGQWLSHRIISGGSRTAPLALSATCLALLVLGFGVLTFEPPHLPLFEEVSSGSYGPT